MPKFFAVTLDNFQRAVDELFDDLLIERWRLSEAAGGSEHAIVRDLGDRYEVRIALGDADPDEVDVAVSERRLTVRIPNQACGVSESSFSFSEPVARDAVSARAVEGTLAIMLPKKGGMRRVRVAGR